MEQSRSSDQSLSYFQLLILCQKSFSNSKFLKNATSQLKFKFLSCALTLYCGYALCGWLVLGPYNDKFRTLTVTSETLFSLLNGDDMFNTFEILEPRNELLKYFFGLKSLFEKSLVLERVNL